MVTIRAFLVALCVALFAGSAARADEPKKSEEKRLALFSVPNGADEIAAVLRVRLGYDVARVPLFSAIFVWGTEGEVSDVSRMLAA